MVDLRTHGGEPYAERTTYIAVMSEFYEWPNFDSDGMLIKLISSRHTYLFSQDDQHTEQQMIDHILARYPQTVAIYRIKVIGHRIQAHTLRHAWRCSWWAAPELESEDRIVDEGEEI